MATKKPAAKKTATKSPKKTTAKKSPPHADEFARQPPQFLRSGSRKTSEDSRPLVTHRKSMRLPLQQILHAEFLCAISPRTP